MPPISAKRKRPSEEPVRPPMAATGLEGFSGDDSSIVTCREKETTVIVQFCKDCATRRKAASMYISGTPGVGKTLTIKSSQRIFGTTNELKDARIVNINAMQLCDPEKVFPLLYQELFCTGSGRVHVPPKHTIRQKLAERLQHSWRHDKHMTFLFVDEIDMLLEAKNVSVLHTLFEYPFHQDSKLVVIGIANSIDLTERTLPFLAQRNFAPKTLHFLPYNAEQLMSIIKQRIADAQRSVQNRTDIEAEATHGDNLWGVGFDKVDISDNAIEFCARKVAAVSGDVRKLLALCSKSITLAARGTSKDSRTTVVAIGHVSKAATELFGGKYVDIIRGLPQQQRVAVCAAVKLLRGSNATATTDANASSEAGGVWVDRNPPAKDPDLGKLYSVYSRLCQSHGLQSVNAIEFTDMCETSLVHHRILDLSAPRNVARKKNKLAGGRRPGLGGTQRASGGGRRVTLLVKQVLACVC